MLGYASSSKGYKLWDEDLRRMVVSRSVRFDESVTDIVDIDTDSETDEEVQTVPATEVKSVPVLAGPQMTLRVLATHQQ